MVGVASVAVLDFLCHNLLLMSTGYEIDAFTQPAAIAEFVGRQRLVHATVGSLGLRGVGTERPALAFGTGAWAMHNLDGATPGHLFDLDVVVPGDMFERLRDEDQFASIDVDDGAVRGVIPRSEGRLAVDVFTCADPSKLNNFTGGVPYHGEATSATVEIDGLHVVQAGLIAATKSMSVLPRAGDLASLLRAHSFATHLRHDVLDDPMWTLSVGTAMGKLLMPYNHWRPELPSWADQLVDTNFDHPAFRHLPRLQ